MKVFQFLARFSVALCIALLIVCIGLWATGNAHLIKAVRSTYLQGNTGPTIDDYVKFSNRIVQAGNEQIWQKSNRYNTYQIPSGLLKKIEEKETTALVVIKGNKLLFEKYWGEYSKDSKTNSFSVAKSFTSLCIGAAIQEGKIKSVHQKISDFLPEFKTGEKSSVTIKDLLTMSSGIDFGESYGDPFGFMAKTYYGSNLYELTLQKELKNTPGEVWKYQGGNTLLLSFILKKATGKNLSEYFSEHFWKPIGASQNALWTTNEEKGIEKSYCCFYSNALDFARIGQLMLDSGKWQGKQLISQNYFMESIEPVRIKTATGQMVTHYGYQWWLGEYQNTSFSYARGILGQYIVSIPEWNLVLVRLGHERDKDRNVIIPKDLFNYLDFAQQIHQNITE